MQHGKVVPCNAVGRHERFRRQQSREELNMLLTALKHSIKGTQIKLEYDSASDSFKISVSRTRLQRQVISNNRGDQILLDLRSMQRTRHQSLNNCIFTTTTTISRSALGIQKKDAFRLFANGEEWMNSEISSKEAPASAFLATISHLSEALKNMPCMMANNNSALSRFFQQDLALPAPSTSVQEVSSHSICDDLMHKPSCSGIAPITNVRTTKQQRRHKPYPLNNVHVDVETDLFRMIVAPRQRNTVLPSVDVDVLTESMKAISVARPEPQTSGKPLAIEWK